MNTNNLPLAIFFGNKSSSCDIDSVRIKTCTEWTELFSAISQSPKIIIFHINAIKQQNGTVSEFMMMLETMIKYSNIRLKPNIGVGIDLDTPLGTVKELQKHKILAVVPSTAEHTRDAVQFMLNDQAYWPKDIINKLPGNEHKKTKTSYSLTDRQQEVFDLIAKRGLSNKQIARVLNISESTVKIHVSAVMKNLCVRNRTQLALTK